MDPITATAGVLGTVGAVSAYGARAENKNNPTDSALQTKISQLEREIEILKKAKEICEAKTAQPSEPTPAPAPTPEPVPVFPPEPVSAPEPIPTPEPEPQERELGVGEMEQCQEKLTSLEISNLPTYRKWAMKNKDSPDLPDVNNCVDIVLKGRKGGVTRKKKLRTRRVGKQRNVRRTRGGQNRTDRPNSNVSRRFEKHVGRNEFGI